MGDLSADPTLGLPFSIIHRAGPIPAIFLFPIAPQRQRVEFPARGAISQTLTSNFLDDFSGERAVLASVSLRGTFGFNAQGGGIGIPMAGSLHLKTLETIFETFNALSRQLKRDIGATQEYLGLARLHAWRIWIDKFAYDIASTDPLLYYYDIHFYRLQDYLSPVGLAGAAVGAANAIAGGIPSIAGSATASAAETTRTLGDIVTDDLPVASETAAEGLITTARSEVADAGGAVGGV